MQTVVDSFDERFHDLFVFNASNRLSPNYCPSDREVRKTISKNGWRD